MKETKQDTPVNAGNESGFPPTEASAGSSTIGSAAETTVSDGPINDAVSASTTIKPIC
jgi:hypothetical protein